MEEKDESGGDLNHLTSSNLHHQENSVFEVAFQTEDSNVALIKTDNAPKLPYLKLFAKFISFGCRGSNFYMYLIQFLLFLF